MTPAIDLLTFAGVMALGQFSPGPDMILLTRTALQSGAAGGVKMALGIACGLAVHATVAVAGLALAFERTPVLRDALRWAAAAYLLWLAIRILGEIWKRNPSGNSSSSTLPSSRGPFVRGLFCNLLNPKAALFLAAVTAPFLKGERPDWWPFAIWAIIVGQAGLLWSLWAWLLQWHPLRESYHRCAQWIDAVFALALAGLAVRLAVGWK